VLRATDREKPPQVHKFSVAGLGPCVRRALRAGIARLPGGLLPAHLLAALAPVLDIEGSKLLPTSSAQAGSNHPPLLTAGEAVRKAAQSIEALAVTDREWPDRSIRAHALQRRLRAQLQRRAVEIVHEMDVDAQGRRVVLIDDGAVSRHKLVLRFRVAFAVDVDDLDIAAEQRPRFVRTNRLRRGLDAVRFPAQGDGLAIARGGAGRERPQVAVDRLNLVLHRRGRGERTGRDEDAAIEFVDDLRSACGGATHFQERMSAALDADAVALRRSRLPVLHRQGPGKRAVAVGELTAIERLPGRGRQHGAEDHESSHQMRLLDDIRQLAGA
jgi:hypothetical protein